MTGWSFVRLKQYTRSCESTVTAAAGMSQPAGTRAQSSCTSYVYLPLPTTVSTTAMVFLPLHASCTAMWAYLTALYQEGGRGVHNRSLILPADAATVCSQAPCIGRRDGHIGGACLWPSQDEK